MNFGRSRFAEFRSAHHLYLFKKPHFFAYQQLFHYHNIHVCYKLHQPEQSILLRLMFPLVYFAMFSANRMRIVASCARVAVPAGASVVSVVPLMRLSAFAHFMASSA